MTTSERRRAIAATLPEGACDCNRCLEVREAERQDTTNMTLTVELTANQYVLLQTTLRRAQNDRTRTSVHSLELERLRTLIAEASIQEDE